ncbi:MAG TPA: hypothetical protein VNO84_12490 [Burkholderiaceae bacterium]|nr:hypothetical protein [Burkholderiaceae bacterium]
MTEPKRKDGWRARVLAWCGMAAGTASVLVGCTQPPRGTQEPPPPAKPPVPGAAAPAWPAWSGPARSWAEYRVRAAQRLVEVNADRTYLDAPPDVLLAIPVLEIELNADGSIRRIDVLRYPGQAKDTTQLAIEAVRRAAPFGSVAHLPKPWKFPETFLFRDDRKFKPRTLD